MNLEHYKMTIQQRAAQVLQQIDASLALAEKAKELGTLYSAPEHASYIAASRMLLPASLRCLKTAIEGLMRVAFLETGEPDQSYVGRVAADTLATLCDQWEAIR